MSDHQMSVPTRDMKGVLSGNLDVDAFAALLGAKCEEVSAYCGEVIESLDLRYDLLDQKERDRVILSVIKAIDSGTFKPSGKERSSDWEDGWQETLDEFVQNGYDPAALAPKYVAKYPVMRLFKEYVRPRDPLFELSYYTVYRHYLFQKYLHSFENIFEFGCGTGYNLVIMNKLFPSANLMGLDWARSSVDIVNLLGTRLGLPVTSRRFNYYEPDYSLDIPANSVVVTMNSLEQIGEDYGKFLRFLLNKKPKLVINSEPFLEMYDETNLVDHLAISYHNCRNYLWGYYEKLQQLQARKEINIVDAKRVCAGNLFHEAQSFVVWKPKPPIE